MSIQVVRTLVTKRFIIYNVIGLSGATLDFILFIFLHKTLGINALFATVLSVSAGITNNFILNAFFNFRVKTHLCRRFVSFYLVGLTGILISVVIIFLLHNILGFGAVVAKAVSIPIIVVVQYGLNSRVSFGKRIGGNNKGAPDEE